MHQQANSTAVNHFQNAFNLAAEIGMAGSVNNVYAIAFVVYRRVFRKNCDAALTFKVIGVHYPVLHLFIGAENTRSAAEADQQGSFYRGQHAQ